MCWNLGECTHCCNVGPAGMKCLTCLLDDGNMETWKAVKMTLEKYKQDPAVLNRKEFADGTEDMGMPQDVVVVMYK